MPRSLLNVALLLPLALVGCANPKYGVFATSTNLGIDADATAGKVVIGYDRTEGFVGPGYPKTGTAPQFSALSSPTRTSSIPRSGSSTPPALPPTS